MCSCFWRTGRGQTLKCSARVSINLKRLKFWFTRVGNSCKDYTVLTKAVSAFQIKYIRRKYQFSFTISCLKIAREATGNQIEDELFTYSERRSVYKILLVISGH